MPYPSRCKVTLENVLSHQKEFKVTFTNTPRRPINPPRCTDGDGVLGKMV